MNVCHSCKKPIAGGSNAVLALGNKYHADCFVCFKCHKGFTRGFLTDATGAPAHEECLEKVDEDAVSRDCAGCRKTIDGEAMLAAGRAWHQACFVCAGCAAAIRDEFDMVDQRIFHAKCVPAGTLPDCGTCGKPCADKSFVLDGVFHHPGCIRCDKCDRALTGPYFLLDGKYFHKECRPVSECARCSKELAGSVVDVEGKALHKECFTCDSCRRPFDSSYVKSGDRFLHEDCQ